MVNLNARDLIVAGVICVCMQTAFSVDAHAQPAGVTTPGYSVSIEIDHVDSLQWVVLVDLVNPGPVAAMTLPLRWGNGRSPVRLDSAEYSGLRTEYFALKTFRVDSTKQSVLIGMISDLGGNYPPLEAGLGTIARLHFSSPRPLKTPFAIDTTFIAPHNILQLVSPDVRSIRPAFRNAASAIHER